MKHEIGSSFGPPPLVNGRGAVLDLPELSVPPALRQAQDGASSCFSTTTGVMRLGLLAGIEHHAAFECSTESEFIGVFEVATDRETARNTADPDAHRLEVLHQ